jgi:hypothetical protein
VGANAMLFVVCVMTKNSKNEDNDDKDDLIVATMKNNKTTKIIKREANS